MTDNIINTNPRRPWLAVVLSLITPGLGQIYNGKLLRGLLLIFLYSISIPLIMALLAGIAPSRTTSITFLLLLVSFVIYIFALVDSYRLARQTKTDYQLKEYNRFCVYLFLILIAAGSTLGNGLFVRGKYVEAFIIPADAPSMYPAIFPGDRVLANKIVYDTCDPQRGDLVVFINPQNRRQNCIKRVVALAGDTVERKNSQLYVNGQPLPRQPVPESTLASIPAEVDGRLLKGDLFYETNGPAQYKINLFQLDDQRMQPPDQPLITIPAHHCFVLGDNRNLSHDSWQFGPLPLATIIGRADYLYLPATNWSRFGRIN